MGNCVGGNPDKNSKNESRKGYKKILVDIELPN